MEDEKILDIYMPYCTAISLTNNTLLRYLLRLKKSRFRCDIYLFSLPYRMSISVFKPHQPQSKAAAGSLFSSLNRGCLRAPVEFHDKVFQNFSGHPHNQSWILGCSERLTQVLVFHHEFQLVFMREFILLFLTSHPPSFPDCDLG